MLSSQKLEGKRKFTFKDLLRRIKKALTNETFLYIMKRIFSSLLTLLLVVALVSLLLRLIPDIQLYDVAQYNKIRPARMV